jgi:hypothetical protein
MSYLDSSWTQLGATFIGKIAGDQAGASVSMNSDGTIMAFSSPYNDASGTDTGSISVYQYNNVDNSWNQLGSDIGGIKSGDRSGLGVVQLTITETGTCVKLSADGYTIAIGAGYNESSSSSSSVNSGHVRIFKYENGSWNQLGSEIVSTITRDYFGFSLSLSNDGRTVAIGAPQGPALGNGYVKVYNYNNSDNSWNQIGSTINGQGAGNMFGYSVSLNDIGNILAVGSPYESSQGCVRVYNYSNSTWNVIGQLLLGSLYDNFGWSVSLNNLGNIMAIGAPNSNTQTGYIKTFNYINNSWIQFGETINGTISSQKFGYSVSLNSKGNIVTTAAPYNNTSTGFVKSYKFFSGSWKQLGYQINGDNTNNLCGFSISSNDSGLIIAVGSKGTSTTTSFGNVKVYKYIPPETPFSNVCFPEGTLITTDQGQIPIEQINQSKHTIRKQEIIGITKTISQDKYLVCIEKDALAKNIPSETTYISKFHTLFYNGEMIQSKDLVGRVKNVYKVDYEGEVLYNVLLKNHDKMIVNNLICETLDPKNGTAKMFMYLKENNYSFDEQQKCFKEYNKQAIKNKNLMK